MFWSKSFLSDIFLKKFIIFQSYRTSFSQWNNDTATMLARCDELGSSSCLPVQYEKLVSVCLPQSRYWRALEVFNF